MSKPCEHMKFDAAVAVARLSRTEDGPITHYIADIAIRCADCGADFEAQGMGIGLSPYRPMTDVSATVMHIPIAEPGKKPPPGLIEYSLDFAAKGPRVQ